MTSDPKLILRKEPEGHLDLCICGGGGDQYSLHQLDEKKYKISKTRLLCRSMDGGPDDDFESIFDMDQPFNRKQHPSYADNEFYKSVDDFMLSKKKKKSGTTPSHSRESRSWWSEDLRK